MKPAAEWKGTCQECGRLVHKDGWFRRHPAGGYQVGIGEGTGCKYLARPNAGPDDGMHCGIYGCWAGDCTPYKFTPTGWRHYDCGVAEYAGAPRPDAASTA